MDLQEIKPILETVDEEASRQVDRTYVLLAAEGDISPELLERAIEQKAAERARKQLKIGAAALVLDPEQPVSD